jgi:lipoyl synthase
MSREPAGSAGGSAAPSSGKPRLPSWFRVKLPSGERLQAFRETGSTVHGNGLHTVCAEAHCPNIHDCWSRGTATFMVAGRSCTRQCGFCAVAHLRRPPSPDPDEPRQLAEAVAQMRLDYVVITVVNRDDLPDGGASHYRQCLDAVHDRSPEVGLELLCSDLEGNETALAELLDGAPLRVFAHNVETVERLTGTVRDPRASFRRSLHVLEFTKELRPDLLTKSSLMVGLGETDAEVTETLRSLRESGTDLLTIGQYLSPSPAHHPVVAFPTRERFKEWQREARELGFLAVVSGPLVRSSFRAGQLWRKAQARQSLRLL